MNARTAGFKPFDPLEVTGLLSDEERAVRSTVRAMCDQSVQPHIAEWFETGAIPDIRSLFANLGALGLLGMQLDGHGCAGVSATAYGLACLELEATDSGLRSMVSVQGSLAMYAIWRWGSEEQKGQWLPAMAAGTTIGCFGLTEPDAGSDPAAMRTHAVRNGSDWVINGRKTWITNAPVADLAVVWAKTDGGVRGFLVPTGTVGITAPEIHHKLSLRASVTGELVLDDVRVPAESLLPHAIGLRGPLSCLNEARYGIIWGAMGAARSAFAAALEYACGRIQFGRPISGFQLTQQKVAEMATSITTGTLLALHLGRSKERIGLLPTQVSMGKLNNVRAALEVCRSARTIVGANGISLEYPIIRHMVNLESVLAYEGTHEMHTLILGEALTGQAAFR